MKKQIFAALCVLVCCMGNEAPAAADTSMIRKATELVRAGNDYVDRATEFTRVGDASTGCVWFSRGLKEYTNAYIAMPIPAIRAIVENAAATYDSHC